MIMTSEEKDILIEKMIDRPESLRSDEISRVLSDPELRDLYDISVRLTDELSQEPEVNVDAEWVKMRSLIAGKKRTNGFKSRWMWIAAGVVAILICATVAIKLNLSTDMQKVELPCLAKVEETNVAKQSCVNQPSVEAAGESLTEEVADEPEQMGQKQNKKRYGNVREVQGPDSSAIDEYLRIREARIDNEVSVALARIYQEDYSISMEALAELLDSGAWSGDSVVIRCADEIDINRITML